MIRSVKAPHHMQRARELFRQAEELAEEIELYRPVNPAQAEAYVDTLLADAAWHEEIAYTGCEYRGCHY